MASGESRPGVAPQILADVREGVTLLTLTGEHDVLTAPVVRTQIDDVLAAGGPLIVDLTGAGFVDSSILGAVMAAVQRGRADGTGLAVILPAAGSTVHRIFEVTGLLPLMPRADTVDAALNSLRPA